MKKIINIWQKIDSKYSFFNIFVIAYFGIYMPFIIFLPFFGSNFNTRLISFPLLILVGISLLLSIPYLIKRITYVDVLTFFILFVLIFVSYVSYGRNRNEIISTLKTLLSSCFFFFIIFRFLNYNKKTNRLFILISLINIALLFVASIIHLLQKKTEDMSMCYLSLFYSLITLSFLFNDIKNKKSSVCFAIFTIFGIISTFLFGSRGPLLIFFITFLWLLYSKIFTTKQSKKIFFIILITTAVIFVILFFLVVILFPKMQYQQQVFIQKLLKIFSLSGRDYLGKLIFNGFKYSPFLGNGLLDDRFLSIGFLFNDPKTTSFSFLPSLPSTTYSHNVILELLVSCGIISILAVAFLLVIGFRKIRTGLKCNVHYQIYLSPLFFLGIVSLFLSNSFIVSNYFWAFLGFIFNVLVSVNANPRDMSLEENKSAENMYIIQI